MNSVYSSFITPNVGITVGTRNKPFQDKYKTKGLKCRLEINNGGSVVNSAAPHLHGVGSSLRSRRSVDRLSTCFLI